MVAAIVCAVSCGDPNDPTVVDPESISTVKTSYIIGSEGGRLEVSVLTNVDITVECAEPWVECVVTKAAENKTVKVTVQENTSTDRRSAKITVKGKEKSIEITLVQDGAEPEPVEPDVLEAGTTAYSVPAEGGEINVAVTTNVDMTVTTDSSWIKYTSTKAASQKTVCFTVEANTAYEARTGKATISGGDKTVEIVFNQDAAEEPDPDQLTVSQTEYTVGSDGGSVEVKVSTNCESVSATVDQTWAKFVETKAKRAVVDKTLTFSVEANTANEERSFTATITAGDQTATVTVKQAAAEKPVEPDEPTEDPVLSAGQATYDVPAEGQDIVVEVTTNIDYTVTCDATWITKVETKASRVDRLTFTVAPNTVEESRSAQIKFDYGEISVTVTVNQEAYVAPEPDPELTLSDTELTVDAEGGDVFVDVTANFDVTVTNSYDWISYNVLDGTYVFTAAANDSEEERQAVISFACKELVKSVTIIQAGAELGDDPLNVGSDLSKNETANTYVVLKAGSYSFRADVMGNGEEGFLEEWTDAIAENSSIDYKLYPAEAEDTKIVTRNNKSAEVLWCDGDCVSDVALSEDKKTITFKANGNEGAALIALKDKSGIIVWSWMIWCTDRPEEFEYLTSEGNTVSVMDRNLGAVSADPADGTKTYGYYFQGGRKDPLKGNALYENNAETSIEYSVMNPTVPFFGISAAKGDNEWFNGKFAAFTPDLWGDHYYPVSHSRNCIEMTDIYELKKTIYDPCPPGYIIPTEEVWLGYSDLAKSYEMTDNGTYLTVENGKTFFPYTGIMNAAAVVGSNENPDDLGAGLVRYSKVWSSTSCNYAGSWIGTKVKNIYYFNGGLLLDLTTGLATETQLRFRAIPVRCMRIPAAE